MKLTCSQCSRVIFDVPRVSARQYFCDNDFCLEEHLKVEQGVYRYSFLNLDSAYFSDTTHWQNTKRQAHEPAIAYS
jgi:hypothetical protein